MSIQKLGQSGTGFLPCESDLSIKGEVSCEFSQFFFFRSAANDREVERYAVILQKFQRLQKQISAFVRNEPSNEDDVFVASDVRDQSKGRVIVRIADHK